VKKCWCCIICEWNCWDYPKYCFHGSKIDKCKTI